MINQKPNQYNHQKIDYFFRQPYFSSCF